MKSAVQSRIAAPSFRLCDWRARISPIGRVRRSGLVNPRLVTAERFGEV